MTDALAVIDPDEPEEQPHAIEAWTPRFAVTVDDAVALVNQKREFMKRVMREDEHYGVIPGTGTKPTLLKPGAELLLSSMGLHPRYRDTAPAIEDWTGIDHGGEPFFRYRKTCMITRSTGPGPDDYVIIAEAGGNCNSWEKKYRYRNAQRICPTCEKPAIIKGKTEYGGGWVCFKNKGGCGAKFGDTDQRITGQEAGQVPNPDIADVANTIEKMADKRGLIAATLLATGCSDIFTQDLEDALEPTADEQFHAKETARRAGTTPPPPLTPRASSGASSPAPKTPAEVFNDARARAKPAPAIQDDELVCPGCGRAEFLRPRGNPRFCAKSDGGCGNPPRGEVMRLVSYAQFKASRI